MKKLLIAALLVAVLGATAGCSTHISSLGYQPTRPVVGSKGIQAVTIGAFVDNRGVDPHWLGAVRGGYGNVLKKLTTDKPMGEVVRGAFVEALAARKIGEAGSARVAIEGSITKFDCSYFFNREAHAHLQVNVFSLPSRKQIFSQSYKTDNREPGRGAGIFGDPDHLAQFGQRTLNETIDKVIADPAFIAAITATE